LRQLHLLSSKNIPELLSKNISILTQWEESDNIIQIEISRGSKRVASQRPTESVRQRLKADIGGEGGKCVRERRGDPVGCVKAVSNKSEWNRGSSASGSIQRWVFFVSLFMERSAV
jgi:hypothetical protein